MNRDLPEPWLRGPVPGIPLLLQPAAHAFIMAREDVDAALDGVTPEQLFAQPGGAASLAFHLVHLAGSTDRLLTYARGARLDDAQKAALAFERNIGNVRPPLSEMLATWHRTVSAALAQLAATSEATLLEPRAVGRAQLPSSVLGLIFHAAEHASRHTGQIVTTAKLLSPRELLEPRIR
jgi:uncharacterized damage-inducible protein DinB